MDLNFQRIPLQFLQPVIQEVQIQEETADLIVPDSYPDIATLADSAADIMLRGKDCRDGSIILSGGIRGMILYNPEDLSDPRCLETYLPFSIKIENSALSPQTQVQCCLRVRSVDARMINSRKALLRVNFLCDITAWNTGEECFCELNTEIRDLQVKKATYHLRLPHEYAEKTFPVTDTLELLQGKPSVSELWRLSCGVELTDQKIIANKAVFKGVLNCKVLYLAEDEHLYILHHLIPFSHYCDLGVDYDDADVDICMAVTGCDLEPEGAAPWNRAILSVNLLAQCCVWQTQEVCVVEDAYTTRGTLDAKYQNHHLNCCLDRQSAIQNIHQRLNGELDQILDTEIYWDQPDYRDEEDQMEILFPSSVHVLGYDNEGHIRSITGRIETTQRLALHTKSHCQASIAAVGDVVSSCTGGTTEVVCSVKIQTACFAEQALPSLSEGSIEEETVTGRKPTIIVKTVKKGTELWDLAKTYRTTTADIAAANYLEGDQILEDMLILLPMH